jgi:hypothetical protein
MILTKEIAQNLTVGTWLYSRDHTQGGGKQPLQVRVNGRCKTWKTRPGQFRLPVKWGLRDCGYITEYDAEDWDTDKEEAWAAIQELQEQQQ